MRRSFEANAEVLPGYKLGRFLGQGGFGEVWEAEAPGGLAKAVKLVPVANENDPLNSREMEGLQKIRSIRHPYLLSIERFEICDGNLVIVMELADKSLAEHVNHYSAQGLPGIPRDELIRYMRETAEVLDLISAQHGLQHLDIKPENLFLSSGHIKVADFGLVQPKNTHMSRSALALSPLYAPPELFDGRVEPTADQYSLAVTYQEMLTRTRPYDADDVRGLLMQMIKGRPDLSAVPACDRPILARAYQREADKRFSSCTEFVEALAKAAAFGTPVEEPKVPYKDANAPTVRRPSMAVPQDAKPRTMAVGKMPRPAPAEQSRTRTTPISGKMTQFEALDNLPKLDDVDNDRKVSATFVAFLPMEIFAHKLRGFIDAMNAQLVLCDNDKAVVRIGARGWFGLRQSRSMFIKIDTFTNNPHSGYRVVDASVWSSDPGLHGPDLSWRGMLLIRIMKQYLMAIEDAPTRLITVDARLRAEILS